MRSRLLPVSGDWLPLTTGRCPLSVPAACLQAADSQESFLEAIRKDFPRELVPVVLAPLIYAESGDIPVDKITNGASMEKNLVSPATSGVSGDALSAVDSVSSRGV